MKALNRWTKVLALSLPLLLPMASFADAPLAPAKDYVHETDAATVRGSVERNRTSITQHGVPHSPTWSIPVWARWYSLSPEADAILVLNNGGNLLGSRDPAQVVMTAWYLEGASPKSKAFTLAEVMNPADMPRTVSHYLWLESYSPDATGWKLKLADGRRITVTYR